jgi:hypothetical protein
MDNTKPLSPELEKLIAELAEDFAPMVKEIEGSLKTTQNHYGRYMALISGLAKGNRGHAKLFAHALIKAGANAQGVASAMQFV